MPAETHCDDHCSFESKNLSLEDCFITHDHYDAHGKHHVHDSGVGQNVELPYVESKYLMRLFSFLCKNNHYLDIYIVMSSE